MSEDMILTWLGLNIFHRDLQNNMLSGLNSQLLSAANGSTNVGIWYCIMTVFHLLILYSCLNCMLDKYSTFVLRHNWF